MTVTECGRICFQSRGVNLSTVFAGQNVGIKQAADRICLVSVMQCDLGFFDNQACRLEPADNPFKAKMFPSSPVSDVACVTGMRHLVPGCAWALADILVRAGVPAWVFNLVMDRGSVVRETLVNHPDVAGISFPSVRAKHSSFASRPHVRGHWIYYSSYRSPNSPISVGGTLHGQ